MRYDKRTTLVLACLLAACTSETPASSEPPSCAGKSGCITTIIGTGRAMSGKNDVLGWKSDLYSPQDATTGPDGKLYYIDWNNHRIRVWDPVSHLTTTVAGTGELGDLGNGGPALSAQFNHPTGIIFDAQGRLVIAAWHNSRIKRVDFTTGILEDTCGTGARAYAGDGVVGGAKTCKLDLPAAVAFDSQGNTYISDQANQRIRKVDASDTITTVVGDLWFVDADGKPLVDKDGNFVDFKGNILATKDKMQVDGNGAELRDASGKPAPYTGPIPIPDLNGGYAGDGGPAKVARIQNPKTQSAVPAARIVIDKNDQLYLADTGNNAIRKVDLKTGIITTIAGTGAAGYAGDGGDATKALLNNPTDVDLLPDGGLLIADKENDCIRVVRDGKISTFAGMCGVSGFAGDGGLAVKAKLQRPYGVSVGPGGEVYVADTHNHRIRMVTR